MSNTTNEQDRKEFSFEENFIDETIIADKSSKTKEFIKKFMKRKTAVAGFIVIVFLVFLAIFGQYLAPYDPDAYDYSNMLAGPSAAHLFGTDHYGRDILSRLLAGTRLTLGVSLSSVVVGAALGTVLGLLAGYYGGIIESLVMRASDVLFSFPDILLAIAIVSAMGQSTLNLVSSTCLSPLWSSPCPASPVSCEVPPWPSKVPSMWKLPRVWAVRTVVFCLYIFSREPFSP